MSIEIKSIQSEACYTYIAEWNISKLSEINASLKSIRSPVFFPHPHIDLKFCFEILYQVVNGEHDSSIFKLSLLNISDIDISPLLKLQVKVNLKYQDGTSFKQFQSKFAINVKDLTFMKCVEDISKLFDYMTPNVGISNFGFAAASNSAFGSSTINTLTAVGAKSRTTHGLNIQKDSLILKFELEFSEGLTTPTNNIIDTYTLDKFKKFAQHFDTMYECNVMSDIEIIIKDESFAVHKCVLAAHSPVFQKMLTGDFLEAKSNEITITDCEADIFQVFLKYLYSGVVKGNLSLFYLKELYYLADKYDISVLKQDIVHETIKSHLNEEHIYEILKIAYDNDEQRLKSEAKKFVACHYKQIILKEEWKELIFSCPLIGFDMINFVFSVPIYT